MADPAGRVLISFNPAHKWNTVSPTWTRIDTLAGCRVREWSIDRGRPNEFARTDTGSARVHIIDLEGIFDPNNAASPYAGNILPGRQAAIGLQNPVTSEWFTMFRGFIESWNYRLDQTRSYMELELELVDGFAILARAELQVGVDGNLPGAPPYTSPPYATVAEADANAALAEAVKANVVYLETTGTVDDRINAVLGGVNWPTGWRDIFTGNVRLGDKVYGPGTTALEAIWDAVDGEFPGGLASAFIDKDGLFRFRGRQAKFRPDVAGFGIQRRTVGDPSATATDTAVVPISELEWSLGAENIFNACSATPERVYSAGTGVGDPTRPLDPELDDVPGQFVTDASSITDYGLRSLTFDNLQTLKGIAAGNDSMVETRTFAEYYVTNYKQPAARINRMVFKSRQLTALNATALWNHITKCELTDLLTVETAHPGGGGFDDGFYVEGIHMTCRPGSPTIPIVELSLDVSPQAHWAVEPGGWPP